MAEYPTIPVPAYGFTVTPVWSVKSTPFDFGNEQRSVKQTCAKHDVQLAYPPLSKANMQILWNFYAARNGSVEAFYIYTLDQADWDNILVGYGDASTTIFDLPGKSSSSQSVYLNGVVMGSGYTILTGGGSESSDRISFTAAPALNDIIACDFTGYMRIRCRFDGSISRQNFTSLLYQAGSIKLKGLTVAI